jgi:hypothetical protein
MKRAGSKWTTTDLGDEEEDEDGADDVPGCLMSSSMSTGVLSLVFAREDDNSPAYQPNAPEGVKAPSRRGNCDGGEQVSAGDGQEGERLMAYSESENKVEQPEEKERGSRRKPSRERQHIASRWTRAFDLPGDGSGVAHSDVPNVQGERLRRVLKKTGTERSARENGGERRRTYGKRNRTFSRRVGDAVAVG